MVYLRVAVCSCVLLSLAGCGKSEPPLGKLVPVQGKITLADGQPLTGGYVEFVPIRECPQERPEGSIHCSRRGNSPCSLGED